MQSANESVTFVVPGDLHLTQSDRPNYKAAVSAVMQINRLVKPHFVQFIGDNVQDAKHEQFGMFLELKRALEMPSHALVGDHDICGDGAALKFRRFVGEPYGSTVINRFRFVRLNTLEIPRLGFSDDQLNWLENEFQAAHDADERVIIFQHHFPYKVCEDFSGPGIDRWRDIIATNRPIAIICGHTHYWQIANNGHQVSVAVRSIGDPEGGAPGYLVAHLEENDLALIYRTIDECGPCVLITHPRDQLLATGPDDIVSNDRVIRVRVWSTTGLESLIGTIDQGSAFELQHLACNLWTAPLVTSTLEKGLHTLEVIARSNGGLIGRHEITFCFDPTRRFTAVPCSAPVVTTTNFC